MNWILSSSEFKSNMEVEIIQQKIKFEIKLDLKHF